MTSTNIRVDHTVYEWLKRRATDEQNPMGAVVSDLIRDRERREFREAVQSDFARLRQDPEAWAEYQTETELWDQTIGDGLENEPPYYDVADECAKG